MFTSREAQGDRSPSGRRENNDRSPTPERLQSPSRLRRHHVPQHRLTLQGGLLSPRLGLCARLRDETRGFRHLAINGHGVAVHELGAFIAARLARELAGHRQPSLAALRASVAAPRRARGRARGDGVRNHLRRRAGRWIVASSAVPDTDPGTTPVPGTAGQASSGTRRTEKCTSPRIMASRSLSRHSAHSIALGYNSARIAGSWQFSGVASASWVSMRSSTFSPSR